MKVKDLIKKLDEANPDYEVFAAPLIFIPVMQLNTDDGTALDGEIEKVANPFERYAVVNIGLFTDLERGKARNQSIILGYDTDKQTEIPASGGFVN